MKQKDTIKELNIIIGQNLKAERIRKNINANEFAKRLGITKQQLYYYEKGITNIPTALLFIISKMLDINFNSFIIHCKTPKGVLSEDENLH